MGRAAREGAARERGCCERMRRAAWAVHPAALGFLRRSSSSSWMSFMARSLASFRSFSASALSLTRSCRAACEVQQ